MTVETEVAALTTAVDKLTTSVDVSKSTLDAKVATAASSITSAEAHKNSTNTLKTETGALKDLAVSAASSASTDAANAYQDLAAIAESKSVTAADVFVYDTSKDSDGGAWRNRTQGKSWYNEAFDSNRGSAKKFPAVAVITVSDTEMFIYDADDPSMPVWMRFGIGGSNASQTMLNRADNGVNAVTALNGAIYLGCDLDNNASGGARIIDFIKDTCVSYSTGLSYHTSGTFNGNIRNRNSTLGFDQVGLGVIVNSIVNDIAVTVLPNAPIDLDTGLPVPTIAVATDGGVSVIKDDGSVVSKSSNLSNYNHTITDHITFDGEDILFSVWNNSSLHTVARWDYELTALKGQYTTYESIPSNTYNSLKLPFDTTSNSNGMAGKAVVKTDDGVALAFDGYVVNAISDGNPQKDLINIVDNHYNTGWMLPETKLATLMDTATGTIAGTEYVTNGDFATASDWTISPQQTGAGISNGQLEIISDGTNVNAVQTLSGLTVGGSYTLTFDYISRADPSAVGIAYLQYSSRNIYRTGALSLAAAGTYSFSFIAHVTTGSLLIGTYANTGQGFTIDNVSVKRSVADRSANDKALQITGDITKDVVATGAELVGYAYTADSSKLQMPNVADIGAPESDYCWMWWQKGVDFLFGTSQVTQWQTGVGYNPTTAGYYFSCGGSVGNKQLKLNHVSTALAQNTVTLGTSGLDNRIDTDNFNHFCVVKRGADLYTYINGKLDYSNQGNSFVDDIETTQGDKFTLQDSGGYSARVSLFRISATAPTAEQIAKIYRDEKPLFQEGAKCTIYGDEKDVRALAFDEDTKLLHVGTTGSDDRGRSDFQGFQRVNNTTYGVATAISAANGLVVEE